MNSLPVRTSKRTVQAFRTAHGPMEGWSSEEHALFQDVLSAAKPGRLARLRLRRRLTRLGHRVPALALTAYIAPLYALDEVILAVHGEYWQRLDRHVDRADAWLSDAEDACIRAGDRAFVRWIREVTDRLADMVLRMTERLAKS